MEAEAAELVLDGDAVQAQVAHLRPERAGKGVVAVDLGGDRRDAVGGETGGGVADGVGGFAEAEIHGGSGLGHGREIAR